MLSQPQKALLQAYRSTAQKCLDLYRYLANVTAPYINRLEPYIEQAGPYFAKTKEFYKNHKDIILVVVVASFTYLLMRPSKKDGDKQKKRRGATTVKMQKMGKAFVSDNSYEEFKQVQSTTTRKSVVSSSKQIFPKKKVSQKVFLQKIESSQGEQQKQNKIFFEMYNCIRNIAVSQCQ